MFCLINIIHELATLFVSTCTTISLVDESEVCGKKFDKERILEEFLLQDSLTKEKVFPIITIVGVFEIGKSTLARILFNDERVKDYFDVRSLHLMDKMYWRSQRKFMNV